MRRILKALSVAALAAFPLVAVAMEVIEKKLEVYGTLLPIESWIKVDDVTKVQPTPPNSLVPASAYASAVNFGNRATLIAGGSKLGFKGMYPFTDSLFGFWQVESTVTLTGGTTVGFGSRNTFLGMGSNTFGRAWFGTSYSPYFYACCWMSIFETSSAVDQFLMGWPGFAAPPSTQQAGRAKTAADATFNRRQGNSFNYLSPTLGGFSLGAQASTNATKDTLAGSTTRFYSPTTYTVGLFFDRGPVSLKAAYEGHKDYFGLSGIASAGGNAANPLAGVGATLTNPSSRDSGKVFSAAYTLPTKTMLAVNWENLSYTNDDTIGPNVRHWDRNSAQFYVQQDWLPHRFAFGLASAAHGTCSRVNGAACVADGLSAKAWRVQYVYKFNQNFDAVGGVWQLRNGTSASYNVTDRAASPGERQTGVSVGLQVKF